MRITKYIGLLLIPLMVSCQEKPETKEAYITRRVKEKVAAFRAEKEESCKKKIIEKATQITDSILIAKALQLDSLEAILPIVPPKPDFLEPHPIEDSLPVKPFLSLQKDTIKKK